MAKRATAGEVQATSFTCTWVPSQQYTMASAHLTGLTPGQHITARLGEETVEYSFTASAASGWYTFYARPNHTGEGCTLLVEGQAVVSQEAPYRHL